MITIESKDLERLVADLEQISKEMPYAVMRALNNTAFKIRLAEQAEMARVFDRPTKWLLKTIYVSKATAQRLSVAVGPTDWFSRGGYKNNTTTPWERVLQPHVYSGKRSFKAFEKRLQAVGLLKKGWYAVPGQGAKLDAYGNMRGDEIVSILSWIGAMNLYAGDNTNRRDRVTKIRNKTERRGEAYFALRTSVNGLAPGIYKRKGRVVKPMIMFVNSATYQKRLDYFGVGERVTNEVFANELSNELALERTFRQ